MNLPFPIEPYYGWPKHVIGAVGLVLLWIVGIWDHCEIVVELVGS